jgi:hypothetical protein
MTLPLSNALLRSLRDVTTVSCVELDGSRRVE